MKRYSILDIVHYNKNYWGEQQPFYKELAKKGYFTNHLPMTNFYDNFYSAIDHPVSLLTVDYHYHLTTYPLYQKEIISALYFLPLEDKQRLELLMVNIDYKGLWAVLWQIVLKLCYKYNLKEIRLMDRTFFDDVWTHYGFDGQQHDSERILRLSSLV